MKPKIGEIEANVFCLISTEDFLKNNVDAISCYKQKSNVKCTTSPKDENEDSWQHITLRSKINYKAGPLPVPWQLIPTSSLNFYKTAKVSPTSIPAPALEVTKVFLVHLNAFRFPGPDEISAGIMKELASLHQPVPSNQARKVHYRSLQLKNSNWWSLGREPFLLLAPPCTILSPRSEACPHFVGRP